MATARSDLTTVGTRIRTATEQLADVASPRHDAERLVAHVLDVTWSDLWSRTDDELSPDVARAIDGAIDRRASGEPLGYILGSAVFYGYEIECGPGVLVPRPETETLVDVGLRLIADIAEPVVVDIGCGSGAIAIAIAKKAPHARVIATDVSEDALVYARRNVLTLGARVEIFLGDLYDALPGDLRGRVDLVVSNPPYVPLGAGVSRDVHAEPSVAVFAGGDGLDVLRRLVDASNVWLAPGGSIACEIGEAWQADGFEGGELVNDHTGRPRVVWARR